MERSLLETVDLLGLDVMLASVAILLSVATSADFVRQRHRETAAAQSANAGSQAAPSRPELVVTDWFGPSRPVPPLAQAHPSPAVEPKKRLAPAKPRETEVA